MTIKKQFICECGKTFTSSQSCNGHKANCKEHHIAKYGTVDRIVAKNKKLSTLSIQVADTTSKQRQVKIDTELKAWQDAQHICEHCGKIMVNKYGSGRFCSKACACSRSKSFETRAKISCSLQGKSFPRVASEIRQQNKAIYDVSPKYCKICNTKIEYDRRRCSTCTSRACLTQWQRMQSAGKRGGLRIGTSRGKSGTYKGYHCDSTYELVWVIYNLDHNIFFERNHKSYSYYIEGNKHLYYPDFILEDGSLVEIKGFMTELVQTKLSAVTDTSIVLLQKDDLKYAFDYVKANYRYKNLFDLYDT